MICCSSCFKIVLALLTKIIALHVQVFIKPVRVLYFERLVQNIFLFLGLWQSRIPTVFHVCLYKLTEQIILQQSRSRFKAQSGARSGASKGKFSTSDREHSNDRAEYGEQSGELRVEQGVESNFFCLPNRLAEPLVELLEF